jgi:hypothetical protein
MSAKPFLITGLPRSRTAWLSVLMSTGPAICYHDILGQVSDIEDLPRLFQSDFYKHVGIADCGFGFFLGRILDTIKPRTLIVDRDPAEVAQSLHKLGFPRTNLPDLLHSSLLPFRDHPLVMWVPFESLERKRVVQKVFWHLMPGEPFDEVRYEHLAKMRIECDVKKTLAEYHTRKSNLDFLMRDVHVEHAHA